MEKEVLVLDPDEQQRRNLCGLLKANDYTTIPMTSLVKMDRYFEENDSRALILNLDKVAVTNKVFRKLKTKKPRLNIIALSKRQFHPELEEALREHISVCLARPVDSDETSRKEVKALLIDALKETQYKVKEDQMEGQKKTNQKKKGEK